MPLEEYRRKRHSGRTPEPIPTTDPEPSGSSGAPLFVIQEHHARARHWDLRLERDGVLVSWAVPKGLPTDPETVRLAVRTEDHPLEYADFAGQIPAGEYGAGHMTIWDRGTYETVKWSEREIQVVLHGGLAAGRYVLLQRGREPRQWLLRRMGPAPHPDDTPLPRHVTPMTATPGGVPDNTAPDGDETWCYEVRFGGTRVLVRVDGGRVGLVGTDGRELPDQHPELAGLGRALGSTRVLLDGEIGGTPSGLWITDLLHLDGRDRLALPYTERRALAETLPLNGPQWRLVPSYRGGGAAVVAAAAAQGLPSVVAKPAGSRYEPGGTGWIEISTACDPPAGTDSGAGGPCWVRAGGRKVRLTNPDKVLYPAPGFRKRDVLAHYLTVAEVMLPHLAGRPVTLRRWPDGVERTPFYEKNVARHVPDWVRTARLASPGSSRGADATLEYPLLDDAAGLAWAANLAALELHVPQWTVDRDGNRAPPDLLVFDLDPGEGATIVDCARVAIRLAEHLGADGLRCHPRTSGGKGMQLYAPVQVTEAGRTSDYARAVAEALAAEDPRGVTSVMARQRRRGKVFIDWSQNNTAKTTVASYSLRGRELPTVATPVTWDEVRACRRPADLLFVAADLPGRLAQHGDLMAPVRTVGPPLPAAPGGGA